MAKPKKYFFAKDRIRARDYLRRVSLHEHVKPNMKSLKLAGKKNQVQHTSGWKTWEFRWK